MTMNAMAEIQTHPVWQHNRVILSHFDSYSTALVFARWPDGSLLAPGPLPAGAKVGVEAAADGSVTAQTVIDAALETLQLTPAEFVYVGDFDAWAAAESGAVRIHLLRFTTFEAPAHRIEGGGGIFRPISALRGADAQELLLMRKVFDLIMGGGGR
ncbi:hypothetical protein [Viridibacterium curvum]|uniref:Nudix hydrolase domain-containing protein n=1 Tax=Viridibacterium curvum TaxID=1101404 RepID=A0ABP9R5F9_9RHOO